jgi:hypothetical protein
MNIGIDYDGTINRDPAFFQKLIVTMLHCGHSPWVVSCRTADNKQEIQEALDGIIPLWRIKCTGGSAKDWFMRECESVVIDVWIDDEPEFIKKAR